MQAGHGSAPVDVGVEWLRAKGAWSFYILLIFTVRIIIGTILDLEPYQSWSTINILHATVTFFVFHWIKGSPFPTNWVEDYNVDKYTWWEQIDRKRQNTPNRKFFTAVVVALYLLAVHSTPKDYIAVHLANFVAFIIVFIAKMPWMHKVRIFGINK
ncbi:hypothetical protein GAYE_PCTG52G1296 [Galdieria yellowstonensis]|uniref:ORM1-like protein 3 n=1 Tax=Galdieria yellowstonensis TaxID=3028027 RepID=A0AAV9I7M7_9RHOD|nr:hypothetical protein GAYE_PCTG52G1296 [Galdieria yellowstonensis]